MIELVFTPLTCLCLSALLVFMHDFSFSARDNFRSHIYLKKLYFPTLLQARRLMDKSHSARMREIDSLLNVSRQPPKEIFVKTQREARPSVCTLAPPKTLTNRFATGLVPKLILEPIVGDDLRGVFLSNLPVSERIFGAQSRPKTFLGSNVSIKLEPLSNTVITRDLPEALVTSRPAQKLGARVSVLCFVCLVSCLSCVMCCVLWNAALTPMHSCSCATDDLGYARKVTLKYGVRNPAKYPFVPFQFDARIFEITAIFMQ